MYCYIVKVEDIINWGGGDLVLVIYGVCFDGMVDFDSMVMVVMDGIVWQVMFGDYLWFGYGESVMLLLGVWYSFWVEGGDVLVGEVLIVNNDLMDNVFVNFVGCFFKIEEDSVLWWLLVLDYVGLGCLVF